MLSSSHFALILYAVELKYGQDCLLHTLDLQPQEYDVCNQWCTQNIPCGGYTVIDGVCYFKNDTCDNNLEQNEDRTTFLLQGVEIKIQHPFLKTYRGGGFTKVMNSLFASYS